MDISNLFFQTFDSMLSLQCISSFFRRVRFLNGYKWKIMNSVLFLRRRRRITRGDCYLFIYFFAGPCFVIRLANSVSTGTGDSGFFFFYKYIFLKIARFSNIRFIISLFFIFLLYSGNKQLGV